MVTLENLAVDGLDGVLDCGRNGDFFLHFMTFSSLIMHNIHSTYYSFSFHMVTFSFHKAIFFSLVTCLPHGNPFHYIEGPFSFTQRHFDASSIRFVGTLRSEKLGTSRTAWQPREWPGGW